MGDFITITDLKSEMGITGAGNDTLLTAMVSMVQSMWDMLTNRTWGETTHAERYNGLGSILSLKNYPVTSVDYIKCGQEEAIKIGNTGKHSTATVAVTSAGITLTLDGSSSTLTFADYGTMTLLVAAVNALGSGWSATVQGSYGDWKTTELITRYSSDCLDSDWIYLYVPKTYLQKYTLDIDSGKLTGSFPEGEQNIYIKYTAGYTAATVPDWLKQMLIRQASHWYRQAKDQKWDMSSKSEPAGGGTVAFTRLQHNLLPDYWILADMHRRRNV